MKQEKLTLVALEIIIWLICCWMMMHIWDTWFLAGPHGPFRWTGMDFVPFWVGVRDMLFSGSNPYSQEVTLHIQENLYGGPALGEDPMMFVYPAWIFLPLVPFAILPIKWAVILYTSILTWSLINLIFKLSREWAKDHVPSQALWAVILTLGSLPFLIISVTKGQLGYISLIALFCAMRLWQKSPTWAGLFLSLVLIKPTVTILPVAILVGWGVANRQWRLLFAFIFSLGALTLASLIAVGNWIPGYFSMLSITGGMPILWSLQILPKPWNLLYAILILGILGFGIWQSWRSQKNNSIFTVAILAGISLTPMRWIYDLFLGVLIPAQSQKHGRLDAIFASLALLAPWFLIAVNEGERGQFAVIIFPILWALYTITLLAKWEKS